VLGNNEKMNRFINQSPNLRASNDNLPDDLMSKKFTDAAEWLRNKYSYKIIEFYYRDLSGFEKNIFENGKCRVCLKFCYLDNEGKDITIDSAEDIEAIAQITNTIFWGV